MFQTDAQLARQKTCAKCEGHGTYFSMFFSHGGFPSYMPCDHPDKFQKLGPIQQDKDTGK